MKMFECKKVENCFSSSQVYEYRFHRRADDAFIEAFAEIGTIKYHRNFPRPSFQATLADGSTVRGVIGDCVIKVSFSNQNPLENKVKFEAFLEELLLRQVRDGE